MKEVYSLEGLGAVGKTTLLHKLSRKYTVIEEIGDVESSTHTIQKFTNDEVKGSIANNWFLMQEMKRTKKINLGKTIMDRSIYSQIAYNYAKAKITENEDIFKKFIFLLNEQTKNIIFPHMILLESTVEYSLNAMIERDKNDEKIKIMEKVPSYTNRFFEEYNKAYSFLSNEIPTLRVFIPKERNEAQNIIETWIENYKYEFVEVKCLLEDLKDV